MSDAPPAIFTADDIRAKGKGIVDGYGITLEQIMDKLPALGTPDEAAQDHIKTVDYLDGITRIAMEYVTAHDPKPPLTVDEAKELLSGPPRASTKHGRDTTKIAAEFTTIIKSQGLGILSSRWQDVHWFARQQLPANAPMEKYREFFVLICDMHRSGQAIPNRPANAPKIDPFGREVLDPRPSVEAETKKAEALADLEIKLAALKAARGESDDMAKTDETAPVTDPTLDELNKAAAALEDFVDELSGDTPPVAHAIPSGLKPGGDDVIDGEVVDETPADLPAKTDAEKVAERISAAFPDATKEYKTSFFKSATGFAAVATAIDEAGSTQMFAMLDKAIEEATAAAKNMPAENSPKTSENAGQAIPTPSDSAPSNPDGQSAANQTALTTTSQSSVIAPATSRSFLMPAPAEWNYMKELAKSVAVSGMYKDVTTYDKALVIMMKGYALGVDPMTALDGIFVVAGRPYVGAKLMKALLERSGECVRFDVVGDDTKCTVTIQRKGRPSPNVYTFTWEDAVTGKLNAKDTYKNSPKKMLKWRAIKEAVETDFAELAFGLGLVREDDDDDETEVAA